MAGRREKHMRNPFDRQIADTIRNELGNIKASDDLIARTLARINDEGIDKESNGPSTHLSALNMGYIRQQEHNREKRDRKISRLVLGTLAVAAACCVTFNLLSFLRNDPNKVTSVATSQPDQTVTATIAASGVISDTDVSGRTADYSGYIYRNNVSVTSSIYVPDGSVSNMKPDAFRNMRLPSDYRTL